MTHNPYAAPQASVADAAGTPVGMLATTFRMIVAAAMAACFGQLALSMAAGHPEGDTAQRVLSYRYFGAVLPFAVIAGVGYLAFAAALVGLVALLLLRRWGRWPLMFCVGAQLLQSPFTGLLVLAPAEHFIGGVYGLLVTVIVVLSFARPPEWK